MFCREERWYPFTQSRVWNAPYGIANVYYRIEWFQLKMNLWGFLLLLQTNCDYFKRFRSSHQVQQVFHIYENESLLLQKYIVLKSKPMLKLFQCFFLSFSRWKFYLSINRHSCTITQTRLETSWNTNCMHFWWYDRQSTWRPTPILRDMQDTIPII